MLAFWKFWYYVGSHAESVVLCPERIRSLAAAALSMRSGLFKQDNPALAPER